MAKRFYEAAAGVLAERINAMEAELAELREAYEALGGTFEEEEPAAPKLLNAPRRAKSAAEQEEDDGFGVAVGGHFVKLSSERQATIVEALLEAGEGKVVKIDDLAAHYGGVKSRMYADFSKINGALKPAGRTISNVRGLGYRLDRVEA